ncbi:potassium-transporting ATPase subunit KdpC [soil metagenome]
MFKELLSSLRAILVFTVLTGLLYPLALTGLSQLAFPRQANGSQIISGDKLVGSDLIAQKFVSPRYFWPRPSAGDFATVSSGASNQGLTSQKLLDAVNIRRKSLGDNAPSDLLYTSASGLDPHISPAAAAFQAPRVAAARHLDFSLVLQEVHHNTEPPQFGLFGEPRVNVLLLNRALDELR